MSSSNPVDWRLLQGEAALLVFTRGEGWFWVCDLRESTGELVTIAIGLDKGITTPKAVTYIPTTAKRWPSAAEALAFGKVWSGNPWFIKPSKFVLITQDAHGALTKSEIINK